MACLRLCVAFAALVGLCAASPNESFDYVIVGGGTCGLVLANRLTEDPQVTVAVIEAGASALNNVNSSNPLLWTSLFGSSIDYAYNSTVQYGGRSIVFDAGKALGGTSTTNGMTYIRAEDVQIDAWEMLGNPGWNWKSMFPYYTKAERFQAPNAAQKDAGASYTPAVHGKTGHVAVGWPNGTLQGHNNFVLMRDTWKQLGVPFNPDPNSGKVAGFSTWPLTANTSTNTRADSARSYYFGSADGRKNLKVFTKTVAGKLSWDPQSSEPLANGVVVKTASGTIKTISARKEVILSAGSLRSPLLLEQSGVGNPAILKKYKIPVKLALPTVGENLQNQPNTAAAANISKAFSGYPTYVAFATAKQLFGSNVSAIEANLRQKIPSYAQSIAASSHGALDPKALTKLMSIQADLIFKDGISMGELLMAAIDTRFTIAHWLLLPFSRGSVHIQSSDAFAYPAIDPKFFGVDFDMTQTVAIAKAARKFFEGSPVAGIVTAEVTPGTSAVPKDAPDSVWADFITKNYANNNHPVGSLSMMSRSLGGAVDSQLKVYGLTNVRVVDASVMPAQTCGHLSSTLYAIAERAADIIRSE